MNPSLTRLAAWLPTVVALAAAAAGVIATTAARAQASRELPNALVADLGLHVVNVGYQRTLGRYASLQVGAGLYVPWTVNDDVLGLGDSGSDGDVAGAVLRLRTFLHPLGHAPSGLWLSPFAQVGIVRGTRGSKRTGFALAGGLSVGWAWRLGARWLLALGLGAQYHLASFAGSTTPPGFARFAPQVEINVAYRF